MKSPGHVAYDAFRKEVGWLRAWADLSDDIKSRWERVASEAMTISSEDA